MPVSRLIRMDPFSVAAACVIATESHGAETKLEIEPCGDFAWVTSDHSGIYGPNYAAQYDDWMLDTIQATVDIGIEAGALPLHPAVLRLLEQDPSARIAAGFAICEDAPHITD